MTVVHTCQARSQLSNQSRIAAACSGVTFCLVGRAVMFGEMSTLLLTWQQVVPVREQAEGFVSEHPELEAALRDLLE